MIIYKLTNTVNNKIYIGKTKNDLNIRLASHKSEGKNNRSNCFIHKAIRKYGWENFKHEIVEDNINTLKELNKKEQYYIELYTSNSRGVGYNLTSGGDGGLGMSGEKNHLFGKKNILLSERNRNNKGKTYEDLYGEEKANEMKVNASIKSTGRKKTSKQKENQSQIMKKRWKEGIYNDSEVINKFGKHLKNKPSVKRKRVYCPDLNLEFESVSAAAKYTNNAQSNVSGVLSGNLKQSKGYTFKYVEVKNVI